MRAIRKILVAVKDPTAGSLPAVDKAVHLARAFGASIELYHSITEKVLIDTDFVASNYMAEFEQEVEQRYTRGMEAIAKRLRDTGIKASATVDWDYPVHEALVRQALRHSSDLIVAECHAGPRRVMPWLLHLTDWELLRTSPLPVLLVKNREPWRAPVVLAAVDPMHAFAKPSKLDSEILKLASTFAAKLDGSLEVMHSYVPVPPNALMGMGGRGTTAGEVAAASERRARKALQQTLQTFGKTRMPRHVVPGKATEAIPEAARATHCGILAMGAVSRSGLKRVFIGNTAERALNALPCDVLVAKPSTFKSKVSPRSSGIRFVGASDWYFRH